MNADFDPVDGVLTLTSEVFEVRVWAAAADFAALVGAEQRNWKDRQFLRLGRTNQSAVFWGSGPVPGTVSILVGHDDETAEVSFTLPSDVVELVLAAVKGQG